MGRQFDLTVYSVREKFLAEDARPIWIEREGATGAYTVLHAALDVIEATEPNDKLLLISELLTDDWPQNEDNRFEQDDIFDRPDQALDFSQVVNELLAGLVCRALESDLDLMALDNERAVNAWALSASK